SEYPDTAMSSIVSAPKNREKFSCDVFIQETLRGADNNVCKTLRLQEIQYPSRRPPQAMVANVVAIVVHRLTGHLRNNSRVQKILLIALQARGKALTNTVND